MTPLRKVFASLFIVGTLTVSGVACSSSDSGTSTAAWCKKFEKVDKEESKSESADIGKAFEGLAKDAPKAIRKDMDMLASAFTALSDIDVTDENAMKELEANYDENEIDAATKRIETFVKDECGYDLNDK